MSDIEFIREFFGGVSKSEFEDLKSQVEELRRIIEDAGLLQERIRKTLKSIGQKFNNTLLEIESLYNSKRKLISSYMSELNKDLALIGSTKTKNSILWKLQSTLNSIKGRLGYFKGIDPLSGSCGANANPKYHGASGSGILWELGTMMWRLSCFSDCMRRAVKKYSILGVNFYAVYLDKLYRAMDYVMAFNKSIKVLQTTHFPYLIKDINNFISIAGDLSQITKHAINNINKLMNENVALIKGIIEKLANMTMSVKLSLPEAKIPSVIRSSEILREKLE